jgi:hypothetical protein
MFRVRFVGLLCFERARFGGFLSFRGYLPSGMRNSLRSWSHSRSLNRDLAPRPLANVLAKQGKEDRTKWTGEKGAVDDCVHSGQGLVEADPLGAGEKPPCGASQTLSRWVVARLLGRKGLIAWTRPPGSGPVSSGDYFVAV